MSYMIKESLCCDDCDHVMVGLRYDADEGPQCERCDGRELSPLLRGEAKAARDELQQEADDQGIVRSAATVGIADVWVNGKKVSQSEVKAALARVRAKNPGQSFHLEAETDATRLQESEEIKHEEYLRQQNHGVYPEHFAAATAEAKRLGQEAAAEALRRNEDPDAAYNAATQRGPTPQAIARGWYR